MPLYEYECEECGKTEEIMQKFSDTPLEQCRHCSGKLKKLISTNAFHLKGSGWYVTDYSNSNNNSNGNSNNNSNGNSNNNSNGNSSVSSKKNSAKMVKSKDKEKNIAKINSEK